MALQICPKCKELSFTWHIDEDQTPLTQWACRNSQCGYHVLEDEGKLRDCPICRAKEAYSYIIDGENTFWWCFRCGKTETIR